MPYAAAWSGAALPGEALFQRIDNRFIFDARAISRS
jgi:hypothetical protein